MTIAMTDLIDIADRRDGHGFSIEGNEEYREYVGEQMQRLSDALDAWIQTHDKEAGQYTDTPMYNSGYRFANDEFIAAAYDWTDYETNVNFYHFATGIDITWYKHAWRGTYGHGDATEFSIISHTLENIIDECIASLDTTEENQFVFESK